MEAKANGRIWESSQHFNIKNAYIAIKTIRNHSWCKSEALLELLTSTYTNTYFCTRSDDSKCSTLLNHIIQRRKFMDTFSSLRKIFAVLILQDGTISCYIYVKIALTTCKMHLLNLSFLFSKGLRFQYPNLGNKMFNSLYLVIYCSVHSTLILFIFF